MAKTKLFLLPFFLLSLLCSCRGKGENQRLADRIEQVWQLSETDLPMALVQAEELRDSAAAASEHLRQKYDLLTIRLRDKRDFIPTSPDSALQTAAYFADHGNALDNERANYYLGSAYRDLKDYPQAVKYFLRTVDVAEQCVDADTIIWQNALSQLGYLYMLQLNYEDELKMKLQAVRLARQTGRNLGSYLSETASAYRHLNDTILSLRYLDEAYRVIQRENFHPKYGKDLAYILMTYSDYGHQEKLDTLLHRLLLLPESHRPCNYELCLAKSYEDAGRTDSAAFHYESYYKKVRNIAGRYEASAGLQRCYLRQGEYRQAAQWGSRLYETNDSIISQRAFEETQRAHDAYIYYRDREQEQAIVQRYQRIIFISVIAGLILLSIILGGLAFYNYRRKRFMEELVNKERMLRTAKEEIREQSKELKQRKKINKELTQMALMKDAEISAEDVIAFFRKVSVGKAVLDEDSWSHLMRAIETLHPGFHDALQGRLRGQLREPLLRTICLMKIGMRPAQIAQVMDAKKQTVWNRVKRAETTCGDLLSRPSPTLRPPLTPP